MNDAVVKTSWQFVNYFCYRLLLVFRQMGVLSEGGLEEEVEDVVVGDRPLAGIVTGVQFLHQRLVQQKWVEKHLFHCCQSLGRLVGILLLHQIFELRQKFQQLVGKLVYKLAELALEKSWSCFVEGKSWLCAASGGNFDNNLMELPEGGGEI